MTEAVSNYSAPGDIEKAWACWIYYVQGPVYSKPLEVKWASSWGQYLVAVEDNYNTADGLGFRKYSLMFSFVSTSYSEVQLVIDTAKSYHDTLVNAFTNSDEEDNAG